MLADIIRDVIVAYLVIGLIVGTWITTLYVKCLHRPKTAANLELQLAIKEAKAKSWRGFQLGAQVFLESLLKWPSLLRPERKIKKV